MAKGGARVRSGPPADPTSARSEQRGFKLDALPSEGYRKRAPAFPLPAGPSDTTRRKRELEVWRQLWKTPQACAWSLEPWRWFAVAKLCRLSAITEHDPGASAALLSRERELRIEVGLTPDGLRANGWAISQDEVAAKAAERKARQTAGPAPEAELPPLRLQPAP